ncbi:MAG: Flp pilus assembly protein CpaB [Actinomycetota bacterium]|nr:Flp pilus assembly protein CpaB [Actinomycetota bacterium]
MRTSTPWWRELRRAVLWHRRIVAAVLAAGAVAVGLPVLAPDPPATTRLVVAARDLRAGATVDDADLLVAQVPPDTVPDGASHDPEALRGRVLAAPVRRGEPVTDVRVVGGSLLEGYGEGLVAAPVRIADAGAAALLHTGDVVDVMAAAEVGEARATDVEAGTDAPPNRYDARVVAERVRVVVAPSTGDDGALLGDAAFGEGALVVLATTPATAAALARSAVTARLSVVIRGP